jgi:predicted phosphodiesterase
VVLAVVPSLCASLAAAAAEHEPLPFVAGSETLVIIPDTEVIVCHNSFRDMMTWVAENRKKRNIRAVLHVGDVTNNNTKREWQCARKAFDIIEGKIPYILAAGNHDYDHTEGRLTYMNELFNVNRLKTWPTFGDVYEAGKLENHYQFLDIHGRKWIVLSLEMGPRKEVIAWANEVLADHKDRLAIILTHGYLYYGNERYNHLRGGQRASPYHFYGDGADGEMLWNQLVRKHPHVMMVVCGHLSSQYVGYRKDEGDYGNVVHQMLVDYEKLGGAGCFLRLLEFLPDKKTVQVRTYSPPRKEINSPVTKGDDALHPTELEHFRFALQTATRDEPRPAVSETGAAVARPPVHRYTFDGPAGAKTLKDSVGDKHGELGPEAKLDGQGRLVLPSNDWKTSFATLPAGLLDGLTDVSVEVWFTPTAAAYNWHPVFRFGSKGDWLTYVFRTLTVHRAEIAVNEHNLDIQQQVPVEVGKPMHVIVTYDRDGANGRPLLSYYRNGTCHGEMKIGLKLSDITETNNMLGAFAGTFDELRIYDWPLNEKAARSSYEAGPDRLTVTEDVTAPGK